VQTFLKQTNAKTMQPARSSSEGTGDIQTVLMMCVPKRYHPKKTSFTIVRRHVIRDRAVSKMNLHFHAIKWRGSGAMSTKHVHM